MQHIGRAVLRSAYIWIGVGEPPTATSDELCVRFVPLNRCSEQWDSTREDV
jgi:hypothetical protein